MATIDGSVGNDALNGTTGQDVIRGFGGNDTITGFGNSGSGAELLQGGDGNDLLIGGSSIDWIDGDGGNDTINFDGGDDVLNGGADNDEFLAFTSSLGFDQVTGGSGFDRIAVGASGTVLGFNGFFGSQTVEVIDATGYSNVVIRAKSTGGSLDFAATNLVNISAIEGQGGVDFITGSWTNDTIRGGGGDDFIFIQLATNPSIGLSFTGQDSVDGGAGFDNAVFGSGAAGTFSIAQDTATTWSVTRVATGVVEYSVTQTPSIAGSWSVTKVPTAETTTLTTIERLSFAGAAISAWSGTAGADTFVAATADRWSLSGLGGADSLTGNAGDDVLAGGGGADALNGAGGFDLADYGASAAAVTVNLALAAAQTGGGDALGDVLSGIEGVAGSAFDDTLTGSAGDDRLLGGDGDDRLTGGAGADRLQGGAGTDTARYAGSVAGVTIVLGAAPQAGGDAAGDVLDGIENILGSGQADSLTGDVGANRLDGAAGADTLVGGAGSDTLAGDAGADVFRYLDLGDSTAALRDIIMGFAPAEFDLLDLSAIDADPLAAGDQGFAFTGSTAFSGAGTAEVRVRQTGSNTFVEADLGDGTADLSVRLNSLVAIAAADLCCSGRRRRGSVQAIAG